MMIQQDFFVNLWLEQEVKDSSQFSNIKNFLLFKTCIRLWNDFKLQEATRLETLKYKTEKYKGDENARR